MGYELEYELLTELEMVEGESVPEYVNVVAREARLEIERLRAERDAERALADRLAYQLNDFIQYGDHGSLRRAQEALAIHKEARRG